MDCCTVEEMINRTFLSSKASATTTNSIMNGDATSVESAAPHDQQILVLQPTST
jgi:hypothetical protein